MLACSALVALLAPGVAGSPAASLLPDAAASGSSCAACDDETWTRSLAHPAKGGVGSIGTVDVVVSYCNHDLAWLDAYVEGLQKLGAPVRNVTIYSKCQQPAPEAKSGVKWSQTVVELPNVGRCDHTYAYHMSEAYADLADATVYIKDSYDPNAPQSDRVKDGLDQVRDVKETWERTKSDGVSCLYDSGASHGASVWHAAQAVGAFKLAGYSEELSKLKVLGRMDVKIDEKMSRGQHDAIQSMTVAKEQQANFMSPVRPLAAWLKQTTGIALDERKLWPVCYGGNFAATRSAVHRMGREPWDKMKQSLTRGDNIEEGHYAERSWLGMLSLPLTGRAEEAVLKAASGRCSAGPTAGSCLAGQLSGCDCNRAAGDESNAATCDTCGTCWCQYD